MAENETEKQEELAEELRDMVQKNTARMTEIATEIGGGSQEKGWQMINKGAQVQKAGIDTANAGQAAAAGKALGSSQAPDH